MELFNDVTTVEWVLLGVALTGITVFMYNVVADVLSGRR